MKWPMNSFTQLHIRTHSAHRSNFGPPVFVLESHTQVLSPALPPFSELLAGIRTNSLSSLSLNVYSAGLSYQRSEGWSKQLLSCNCITVVWVSRAAALLYGPSKSHHSWMADCQRPFAHYFPACEVPGTSAAPPWHTDLPGAVSVRVDIYRRGKKQCTWNHSVS